MQSPETGPIERSSLHEEIVVRLRNLIFDGQLTPGTRINERLLCEQFGVSRTPLREAVKVLASEELVELLPNRGAVVTSLTCSGVRQLFEVMEALEALAGELACARIDDLQLAQVASTHAQMVLHYRRGELREYFACNQQIHLRIVEATANSVLVAAYRSLSGRIRRARYMANQSQERWDHAVLEHEEILRRLTARDGPALGDLLRRHLANKLEVVTATIEASTIAPKHLDPRFDLRTRDEQASADVNGATVKA